MQTLTCRQPLLRKYKTSAVRLFGVCASKQLKPSSILYIFCVRNNIKGVNSSSFECQVSHEPYSILFQDRQGTWLWSKAILYVTFTFSYFNFSLAPSDLVSAFFLAQTLARAVLRMDATRLVGFVFSSSLHRQNSWWYWSLKTTYPGRSDSVNTWVATYVVCMSIIFLKIALFWLALFYWLTPSNIPNNTYNAQPSQGV